MTRIFHWIFCTHGQGDEQWQRVREVSINEPAEGKKKKPGGRIPWFYDGEGVQHVAIATNIHETVTELQHRGVEFLKVPATPIMKQCLNGGPDRWRPATLSELGILIDQDDGIPADIQ